MSWLLFLDESGHDHKTMPYEVRGGVAVHASRLWPFVQAMKRLELDCFGCELSLFSKELKGSTLLDKKRFKFANQADPLEDSSRRKHCQGFFQKGLRNASPTRDEFTAYGQACLLMADGIFEVLHQFDARLFAAAIPTGTKRPAGNESTEFLRKDIVFLLERYFHMLEKPAEHGLLILDQIEQQEDKRFIRRLERYFTRTTKGRIRAKLIVPTPLFVSSELTYAVQAADLCVYCVNWGFRLPAAGMNAGLRPEIATRYGEWLNKLQYRAISLSEGEKHTVHGIFYVREPYGKKE